MATKVSGFQKSSKVVGNRTDPPGPKAPARLDAASVKAACAASLKRLQTDYIDVYQLHWPDRYVPSFGPTEYDPSKERDGDIPIEETAQALKDLMAEGKVS